MCVLFSFWLIMLDCYFFKVIGDKKGGRILKVLIDFNNMSRLEVIRYFVWVLVKFIYVVRNFFDNILIMIFCKVGKCYVVR